MYEQEVGVLEACDVGYRRRDVTPRVLGWGSHEPFREHRVWGRNANIGVPDGVRGKGRGWSNETQDKYGGTRLHVCRETHHSIASRQQAFGTKPGHNHSSALVHLHWFDVNPFTKV